MYTRMEDNMQLAAHEAHDLHELTLRYSASIKNIEVTDDKTCYLYYFFMAVYYRQNDKYHTILRV